MSHGTVVAGLPLDPNHLYPAARELWDEMVSDLGGPPARDPQDSLARCRKCNIAIYIPPSAVRMLEREVDALTVCLPDALFLMRSAQLAVVEVRDWD